MYQKGDSQYGVLLTYTPFRELGILAGLILYAL